jgi:hypothetical protein
MIATIEADRVYKFVYAGKTRIAWVLDYAGHGNFLCWDFINDGYRTFHETDMVEVQDVTNKVVLKHQQDISSEKMAKWDYDPNTRVHMENGMACAVRF